MLPSSFLTKPMAHRGFHDLAQGRPENSRAAIEAAIQHGYGIEIDLQLTSDAAAVLFHDHSLERLTTAIGPVRSRTRAELATLRLAGGDEAVPDLPEILSLVAGQVPLLVEIKDQDGALGEDVGILEAEVARNLEGYDGPVALMSFNPHSVAALQKLAPDVPRGLVTDHFLPEVWGVPQERCERLSRLEDFDLVGASFISHNHRYLLSEPVTALKARGVPILCWTIRTVEEERAARQVADNVTFEGYLAELPS
ncbi:MAG: glycerophosphodiester phosphodiesterase family protein [Pseudomonadota bacterium]